MALSRRMLLLLPFALLLNPPVFAVGDSVILYGWRKGKVVEISRNNRFAGGANIYVVNCGGPFGFYCGFSEQMTLDTAPNT